MTYIGKFNKLLRRICQLETNDYYSDAQILDQFIAGLKNKLIKKVHPHAPKDLNSAIQHVKRYEMAIEEANCTKLMNLAIGETSSTAEEKIDQLTKKVENYFTNQQQQQPQRYQPPQRRNQNNFTLFSNNQLQNCHYLINVTFCHNNFITNHYYHQLTIHQYHNIKLTTINLLHSQYNNSINNPFNITKYLLKNWFNKTNLIAKNANLSDIFPFKFEANESPFLLSNAAANKQKAITVMYTKAEVKGKAICLILDNESARSIIIYQLIQQLKKNVNQLAQTVIVTADGMKKTPVREIDNFPFTLDGITIPVKVLTGKSKNYNSSIKDNMPEYPLLVKVPVFKFEEKKEKPVVKTFMAIELTSNWAEKTEQMYFATNSYPEEPETPG
ncbi:hypothetical protein G9A89_011446 [Geosiphon pyriformis]|nr:hypothetical protein G9A89_011446 [Geosiphon pyriformis]